MKRNTVTIVVGALLVLIFILLLFTFQVRQTEVVVVTTFDRPTRFETEPGLKWRLPYPIQKIYPFDQRIHNFEGRFEQTMTKDNYPLLAMLYVGWTVSNPTNFFYSFPSGKAADAEPALSALVENAKNEIIGRHPFSHFVSTDEKQLKFVEIEKQVLDAIRPAAESKYGVDIRFVGIKKLGLPESVTEKVFARMQAERDRVVQLLKAEGEARATQIKSQADHERDKLIAAATAKAKQIRGEADAEAAKSLAVFEQNEELAIFLLKLKALEDSLKLKTTLVLDDRTPPYDLLTKPPTPGETTPTTAPDPKQQLSVPNLPPGPGVLAAPRQQ